MPRLVVVSRYLKSGRKKNLSNYVKYIATREGVAKTKENYIGYLANRPGAVKFGPHGLFSQNDEPIVLDKVAKEVAEHKGNVWTHIVSLRRDDAQKMGYDNLTAWRKLIKRQIPNIAKQSKIDMANLKWYAAFHDKENNPHVHIVIYSTNEREGFLTKQGCEKIRSGFMNDIYADELKHLYQQQTESRDLLKAESAMLMKQLSNEISADTIDTEIVDLMRKLHGQLHNTKGKKVYGYLQKDTKRTVDEIFLRLSLNESIQKMYRLWCDMEQTKHDFYSSAKAEFPSMVDNEHFKSVKNMIVKTAAELNFDMKAVESISPFAESGDTTDVVSSGSSVGASEIRTVESKPDADEPSKTDSEALANAAFGLLAFLSRVIAEDYDREQRKLSSKVDKKLRRTIDRKKQELGIKPDGMDMHY